MPLCPENTFFKHNPGPAIFRQVSKPPPEIKKRPPSYGEKVCIFLFALGGSAFQSSDLAMVVIIFSMEFLKAAGVSFIH